MSYPTMRQSRDSKEVRLNGRDIDRATNGAPRGRSFFAAEQREFVVVHPGVTAAEKVAFEAFYAANGVASFSFTWTADGASYTCIFGKADPVYTRQPGNRWDITVALVRT